MDAYIGGAWISPSTAEAFISGSWRSIQYAEAYIGGSWLTIANFSPPTPPAPGGGGGGGGGGGTLSLSLSATTISKSSKGPSLEAGPVTVTPSGGLAPYTYACTVISADAGFSYSLTAPSFATTSVDAYSFGADDNPYSLTFHWVVTDSLGITATSDPVTATFIHKSGLDLGE